MRHYRCFLGLWGNTCSCLLGVILFVFFLQSFPAVCFVKPSQPFLESKENVPHFLAGFFGCSFASLSNWIFLLPLLHHFPHFLFNLPAKFLLHSLFRVLTSRNGARCLTCLFVVNAHNTVTTGLPLSGKNCAERKFLFSLLWEQGNGNFIFWDIDQNKLKVPPIFCGVGHLYEFHFAWHDINVHSEYPIDSCPKRIRIHILSIFLH